MKWFTVRVDIEAESVYDVQAETEDEARESLEQWDGESKDVVFSHTEEGGIVSVLSVEEHN